MADLLRRHGLLISWVVLFILSFQLMSISISNRNIPRFGARLVESVLTPAEKLYHEVSESAKYLWTHYIWLLEVETERNTLLERIKELEALNSTLMESESENQRLRRLLHFAHRTRHNGVVASVIGRDPSNWVKTVTLDRGSADGLHPGLAVVDGNAVVGQTTVVTEHSAKVLLLTDASSGIDAILQSTRMSGIVEGGSDEGMLRLRYVEKLKEFPVQPGDRVIASGLDGVYPKGTLIGVVHEIGPSSNSLFHSIKVRPSADLNRLENVMVIMPGQRLDIEPSAVDPAGAASPTDGEGQTTEGSVQDLSAAQSNLPTPTEGSAQAPPGNTGSRTGVGSAAHGTAEGPASQSVPAQAGQPGSPE